MSPSTVALLSDIVTEVISRGVSAAKEKDVDINESTNSTEKKSLPKNNNLFLSCDINKNTSLYAYVYYMIFRLVKQDA